MRCEDTTHQRWLVTHTNFTVYPSSDCPLSPCALQNMLQAGMIIAGWDATEGGAVYALPLGGTLLKVPFSIGEQLV